MRKPSSPLVLRLERLSTAIGEMLIVTDEEGMVRAIDWEDYRARMDRLLHIHYGKVALLPVGTSSRARDVMQAYFAGEISAIDTLPTRTAGTPFQRTVWEALRTIPAGETWSYGSLAERIGRRAAVRAVGHANGSNPVSVVTPCHRVIGSDGSLTGYGGGLERKLWLLRHEGVRVAQS